MNEPTQVTLLIPAGVDSWSVRGRAEGVANYIPRYEVWLRASPAQDSFGRGIGDVSAMGYGETLGEAFALGELKLSAALAQRLEERNAVPPSSAKPKGLGSDFDELSSLLGLL